MSTRVFVWAAALAAGSALADTHMGNGEVNDNFGEAASSQAAGGNPGGTATSPSAAQPTACPTIIPADGPDHSTEWWARPVCGQPPAPECNDPAMACPQIMPAPRTYPNCRTLNALGATFVHMGRCLHESPSEPKPETEPQRIAIGFEVKSFRQCMARVAYAKRLKPVLAPWIQDDGKPMKTREFCRRLFYLPSSRPEKLDGLDPNATDERDESDNQEEAPIGEE